MILHVGKIFEPRDLGAGVVGVAGKVNRIAIGGQGDVSIGENLFPGFLVPCQCHVVDHTCSVSHQTTGELDVLFVCGGPRSLGVVSWASLGQTRL